jgi:hypothetical protein
MFVRLDPDGVTRRHDSLGGVMRRDLAIPGVARQAERPVRSVACLAFVAILGVGFWAGVMLIAQIIMRTAGGVY